MKWIVPLFVAASLCGIVYWRTDGFTPSIIEVPLLEQTDATSSEISIPSTFRYLARGKQMFAFENGDLVLKFFNSTELKIPWYPLKQKSQIRWGEKIRIYPESYPLALQHLKEETGLLVVHLGRSDRIFPTVELTDKAGRRFSVDLNQVPFVLQKKGKSSFYRALQTTHSNEELQQLIDSYLAFHTHRIAHCIADYDRDIKRNYCWDGTEIQYIDPARFFFEPRLKEEKRAQLEWWKATHRLRKWLVQHAPSQVDAFDQKVASHAASI